MTLFIRRVFFLFPAFFLSGCQPLIPTCGDDATVAMVKDLVAEMLEKSGQFGLVAQGLRMSEGVTIEQSTQQIEIQFPRASSYNEAIGKYECQATVLGGGSISLPVTYESQIDDSGQHIVFLDGISNSDLTKLVFAIVEKVRKGRGVADAYREGVKVATAPSSQPVAPPTAARVEAAKELPVPVRTFMEQTYGKYDDAHTCWHTTYESQPYCMTVLRMDRIAADTGERLYLLAGGHTVDDEGEADSSHAFSGLAGAFVFELRDSGTQLAASNIGIYVGASGSVPQQWDLVKLAKTGYYGWKAEWGDCHQGHCGTRLTLLAPYGKSVKDVANFNISYSNEGSCGDEGCPSGESSLTSKVSMGRAGADSDIYPLMVTFKGILNGEDLSGSSRQIDFDRKSWQYVVTNDWPLSEIDY